MRDATRVPGKGRGGSPGNGAPGRIEVFEPIRAPTAAPASSALLRNPKVELFDTTLRDGEQTAGASFHTEGRVAVFRALDRLGVDYVELGWPVVSEEIRNSFELCRREQRNAGIVAFGSTSIKADPTDDMNLASMVRVRPDVGCIFGKSWGQHVTHQLGISYQANLDKISMSVDFLKGSGLRVFYDAEHYFDGFKDNPEYALATLRAAANAGAERLVLCDTNGGTLTPEATEIVRATKNWLVGERIDAGLGTHFHDDSGVAVANAFATLPWITQVQGTINGMGERIGNLNLGTFAAGYALHMGGRLPGFKLRELKGVVELVYRNSGLQMPRNQHYVGANAFTHRGGVHIDAIRKAATYEHVDPASVGNTNALSLNSLGGTSAVSVAAKRFGYSLDKKNPKLMAAAKAMLAELKVMEMKGYRMGEMEAEQCLLVLSHFGKAEKRFEVSKPKFSVSRDNGSDTSSFAATFLLNGKEKREELAIKGGPVDAAYKLVKTVLARHYREAGALHLEDFHVNIAHEREESSVVRTEIEFSDGKTSFSTVGVDSDLLMSALEAIGKGFRYYLNAPKAIRPRGTPGASFK
jgi:2-isopropylmalate synthase